MSMGMRDKLLIALNTSPGPRTFKEYLSLSLKGFVMGIADLIPGVSGGTIAFVTGIYESLLDAISSLNKKTLVLFLTGEWSQALSQIHVRFLSVVIGSILLAIFSFARVMHYLMTTHSEHTWSLFFGLIAASIVVIFKELKNPKSLSNLSSLVFGAVLAWLIVGLIPVETPEDAWFIILCGFISISAMILPGLSGSFLLLILGKYEYITGAVKNPFAEGALPVLLLFVCGAVAGALGFTRVLNWFLKHYRNATMAFLTGILIGSMKKVWPWKVVLETKLIAGKERILREANILPDLNSDVLFQIALMLVGLIFVLLLDNLSRKNRMPLP
jgi:putative membrane protein